MMGSLALKNTIDSLCTILDCKMIRKMSIMSMLFCSFFSISAQASENPPGIELPVTHQEFLKIVYRGLSKSDLVEKLGSPSSQKPSQTPQFTNLFFQNIIRSSTGRTEGVTVIIFNDYNNVYSVIWSDGTEAKW